MSSEEVHFAQHLAANERKVRDKALARLRKWIRQRSQKNGSDFDESGLMKLWKGLFYCMWMADKPLVQEELADNISSLVHAFSKSSQTYAFIECFFKTMGRNHDQIDKFRIDKFLMLARRFFRESLRYLKAHEWQHKHVQKYLEALRSSVLSQTHNPREMAIGFRLHILDIFLEELARVGEGELPQKRAHNFLEPFYEILTYCKSPMVVEGVRDKIFYELIKLNAACLNVEEDDDDDDDDEENNSDNYGSRRDDEDEDDEDEEDEEDEVKCGKDFLDEEAELDESTVDSEYGEISEVSGDEDEEELSKPRKSDEGFITNLDGMNGEESCDNDEEAEIDEAEDDDGDLEEQLIREQEDAAEVHLLPVDFDMSTVKASLKEFSKVQPIKGVNKRALQSIIKKIIDLENGVDPFALPEQDSGSDLELDENELKEAQKRLKLLENQYAEEAENYLVPDKEEQSEDELDIEGGEDDLEEFERTFVERSQKSKKGRKSSKAMDDSDEDHFEGIERDIGELDSISVNKSRKRKRNSTQNGAAPLKHNTQAAAAAAAATTTSCRKSSKRSKQVEKTLNKRPKIVQKAKKARRSK